jgi:hypothetical protein
MTASLHALDIANTPRDVLVAALRNVKLPTLYEIEAEIERRKAIWCPQPGPQTMAYESTANIIGYGGAAGGGKSDLAIGLAVTQHRRSIIFRREGEQTRGLFNRAKQIVGDRGKPNHTERLIAELPGDREVEFKGIKNIDDWNKYRGVPRDFMAFDEATEFERQMITSLMAWNRTTIEGQRCRIVLPFNPPGAKKGQWIVDFFGPWLDPKHARPAEPGEVRWFTTIAGEDQEVADGNPVEVSKDGRQINPRCKAEVDRMGRCAACGFEVVYPLSRTFIPARLDDNVFLTRDPQYRATLMALPEPLRSQLLYGDFNSEEVDDPWQIFPTRWIQLAQQRWIERDRPLAPLSALGSDVARGGIDRTTTAPRIGNWFGEIDAVPGKLTPDGASIIERLRYVASQYKVVGRVPVGMDVIGVGVSPLDLARELEINVFPINVSEAADENATDRTGMLHFANKRAQYAWQFREALDPEKGEDIALPPDRELLVDLCAMKYEITLRGIKVIDKEKIKKEIGRSPDKGEAAINAFIARGQQVGYQSVTPRPSTQHIARPLQSNWKRKPGL